LRWTSRQEAFGYREPASDAVPDLGLSIAIY
jgi:hypothetical protein